MQKYYFIEKFNWKPFLGWASLLTITSASSFYALTELPADTTTFPITRLILFVLLALSLFGFLIFIPSLKLETYKIKVPIYEEKGRR